MNVETYNRNIQSIAVKNPVLFARLLSVAENQKYDVIPSKADPLDINIYDTHKKQYLYTKNPIIEISEKIDINAKYSRYPFLVFFGFGNGILIKATLHNKSLERLIVVEPELEILFIAMHILDFSEDILNDRLTIYLAQDLDFNTVRNYLGNKQVGEYVKLYSLDITAPYYSSYVEDLAKTNKLFTNAIVHFVKSHGNDAIDSLVGMEHFINNLPRMLKNPTFHSLLAQRKYKTAVVVSTGPSLTKQLPLLKEIQDHILIISVDASLPILEEWGIKPDIVASMERVKETAKFFQKTSKKFQKDVVFVSSSVQHKVIYQNIKDGQLVIAMRPFGYMKFFDFDEYGYCGVGLSAANMAYEIAFLMDCDNLILIGQDLSYASDGKSHATNHVYGESEVQHRDTDSYITAYGGKGTVKTTEIWRLFLGYFVTYIADAQSYMNTFNCTEGGARIEGSIEIPFREAIDRLVDKTIKKEKLILPKPDSKTIAKNILKAQKKIDEILKYAMVNKKVVEDLFLEIAAECDHLEKLNRDGELAKINFALVKRLLKKTDKIKKTMKTPKFQQLFWDTVQSYILSQNLELAAIAVKPVKDENELNAKLLSFLFAHKTWLFTLAGGMEAVITVVKRSRKSIDKEINKK